MSAYAQEGFGGKAASLAANEKTPSAPKTAKAPKTRPSPHLAKAPAPVHPSFSDAVKMNQQRVVAAKNDLARTYGDKFTKLPKWAQDQAAQKHLKNQQPDGTFFTPKQEAQAARYKYKEQGGLPGAVLRTAATSLVPKTVVDLGQGKPVTAKGVVADVGNAALNFAPVGKAAAVLGSLRGLGKIAETAKAMGTLRPAEIKAIQVVEEGTPIADRIAAHQAQLKTLTSKPEIAATNREIALLKRAKQHVTTVEGVPRINPANHKLVEAYQTAHQQVDNAASSAKESLRGSLKGARVARGRQEAMYSAERGQRFAAADRHLSNTNLEPAERIRLAQNELRGSLQKVDYNGMATLDEEAVKHLQSVILSHPHLMTGQKLKAAKAVSAALEGVTPTHGELDLLEHVFGKDMAAGIAGVASGSTKDILLSTLNIPRSLMASMDLSAPFRQGLVVATRHPVIFAKNFGPMIKSFGSERVYNALIDDIHSRPSYPMMMEAKLAITRLGKDVGLREEHFASDMAEKIPIVGHGVRASGRAYTGFLDKTRADVFDHLIQRAQAQGINVQDEKFLKSLGSYINSATGRGDLGHFQEAGKVLNTVFFSPRLLASRLNFMNPLYYARLDPFARKEALRSAIQLSGTLSVLLGVASQIPGAKVVADPRNPDWGKIKIGNTRIDIAGGFQQPLRLFAQLATGTAISSTTGKKLNLTTTGFGKPTRLDLFLRFFEGKEAPWASVVTDKLRNSDQVGNKFKWSSEAYSHMVPLIAQDAYDLYHDRKGGMNGLAAAFAGYGIESVGFGLQTYSPKPPKARASNADPNTSGSPYAQSGGSAGSVYAQP